MAIDTAGESRATAETFEVINPADGSVIESVAIDSPERGRRGGRTGARRPGWERSGSRAGRRWLEGGLRDWILEHHDRDRSTLMQRRERQGARRCGTQGLLVCSTQINF